MARVGRPPTKELAPFGVKLRELIARSDFPNRNRFIKALGADGATVHRWEKGESTPSWDYVQRMAELLGVTTSELQMISSEPANDVERIWREFEQTAVYREMKPATIRTLRAIPWRDGKPTVDLLKNMGTALDSGMITTAEEAADSAALQTDLDSKAKAKGVRKVALGKKRRRRSS